MGASVSIDTQPVEPPERKADTPTQADAKACGAVNSDTKVIETCIERAAGGGLQRGPAERLGERARAVARGRTRGYIENRKYPAKRRQRILREGDPRIERPGGHLHVPIAAKT